MFTDETRKNVYDRLRKHDLQAFRDQLTPRVFAEAARRSHLKIATCPLNLVNLVWLGIAAAWRKTESFTTLLTLVLRLLHDHEPFAHSAFAQDLRRQGKARRRLGPTRTKHDPRAADLADVSEEAFVKARRHMPLPFWVALLAILGEDFERRHAAQLRYRGFRLLALDGTCLTLPESKRLRAFYGSATNGTGRHAPQARMVLLQSPLTRLPLAYELQPFHVGEVTMARRLARQLRADDLVVLDSGYCSYGLMCDIHDRGAFFCIRVQRSLNLRTRQVLRKGRDQRVCWTPKDSRGQWRREGLPRSLELRLIEYRLPGHRTIKLLTNVCSPRRLSYACFTRLTTQAGVGERLLPGLYHQRWQIETSFAEMKNQHGMEGGLRSRTPEGIAYEVAGHVVLYLLVRWLMVEAAVKHRLPPLRLSFCNALRELRAMWPALLTARPSWVQRELLPRLLDRMASHGVPFRPGRSYPRKKRKQG
jgi:Transposase DDE domain